MTRVRTISAVAIAVLVGATTIPAAVSIGGGTYTIQNGEIIVQDIVASSIVLPIGYTAYWANAVTLRSTSGTIEIKGALRDQTSGLAHDVRLETATSIIVTGSVVAANGQNAADIVTNKSATAGNGGHGGNITIKWGALGSFTLAAGATIKTGNGGRGGAAQVVFDEETGESVSAIGGSGGDGGRLDLQGVILYRYGNVILGNGGNGGWAYIDSQEGSEVPREISWIAVGGLGGSTMAWEPCIGCAGSVLGGDGGGACVGSMMTVEGPLDSGGCGNPPAVPGGGVGGLIPGPPGGLGYGAGCTGTAEAHGNNGGTSLWTGGNGETVTAENPCDGTPGTPGMAGTIISCPGWNGGHGSQGGAAAAYGGDGGAGGVHGGDGGEATAKAGGGGRGGNGGNAWNPNLCNGGNGGNGGSGGDATAHGGDGGDGTCSGGKGGIASRRSVGGTAGSGGYPGGVAGTGGSTGGGDKVNGQNGSPFPGHC